jgi:hypothetical protein
METAPPDVALLSVLSFSVTKSQNVLPVSAEPSYSTQRTVIPSDSSPEKNYCLQTFEDQSITGNNQKTRVFNRQNSNFPVYDGRS